MILGDITIDQVDEIYKRMNIHELVIYPYHQDTPNGLVLSGLITGFIDNDGKHAQLDHYIVLPEAPNKLAVMLEMPKTIHYLLKRRGVEYVTLCIKHDDSRRLHLAAWAKKRGYTFYATDAERDWYIHTLKEKGSGEEHAVSTEASGSPEAASAPAARS